MIETFFFKLSHQQQEVEELKGKLSTLRKQKENLENAQQNGSAYSNDSEDSDSQPSSPSPSGIIPSFADNLKDDGAPQSPLKSHIRAFLPNNQRTMVCMPALFVFLHFLSVLLVFTKGSGKMFLMF